MAERYYSRLAVNLVLTRVNEAWEKECNFITNLVGTENEVMINSLNKLGFKSSDLITFYRMVKGN